MVKRNGPLIVIRVTLEERQQLNAAAADKRLSQRRPTSVRRGNSAAASAD